MECKGCNTIFRETTRPKKRQGCGGTAGKGKKPTLKNLVTKFAEDHFNHMVIFFSARLPIFFFIFKNLSLVFQTKCALTVSCRSPGKLGCRSNSPSFCTEQATSHVSSELCTFRCLVRHVCQRCGPVSRKTVGTMVDACQVMITHTIICQIQSLRLTTLMRNESR
jgi:hypothetical protein